MGWSTWNQFKQHISEGIVLEMAQAIKDAGLLSAGYKYINLDDCWQSSIRDENGRLMFDAGMFPSKDGIVGKLNSMGFKTGLYSSCGTLTCEDMPGSYGYEDIDAKTFASWGVEYLKYDYCHVTDLPTDPHFDKSGFANSTPPILYIGVSGLGRDGCEAVINAADAEIKPPAYLNGNAIVGLDCPSAHAAFTVNVPTPGRHQIALGYIKQYSPHKRFLLLSVNGDPCAQMWFPSTSGWNSPSRVMAEIELEAGINTITLTNPIRGQREDSILRYTKMGEALKKAAPTDRPISYAVCEHGRAKPWEWAGELASSWRVTGDIRADWAGVLRSYEAAADLWPYQKPGAYNDPDMLEVGIGNLTDEENHSHFTLWCMMSAPLVLGLDVRKATQKTLDLITDKRLISINQDKLMLQASRTVLGAGLDLLIKPLADDHCAVCLLNKSDNNITGITLSPNDIVKFDARIGHKPNEKINIQTLAPRSVELFII